MENERKHTKFKIKKGLVGIVIGGVSALALASFLFLDWRVKDVCKWSHLAKIPSFSKRIDLISSIFKWNTCHIYFVQDYRDYSSKEKLLDDVNKNRKYVIEQLKSAGFQDNEIEVSPIGKIYEYKGPTPWSQKTELFGINGVTIEMKTSDKKLYKLFSDVNVTISHQPKTTVQTSWPIEKVRGHIIHQSSRHVFSFSLTNTILKSLDCTRVSVLHQALIEEKSE
ncbi:MAG: hypothetical protein J6S86_02470 [Alphaproteobacteria bacterium]|nr:hypothetical protein [Alphaproteobacteria bacterium]